MKRITIWLFTVISFSLMQFNQMLGTVIVSIVFIYYLYKDIMDPIHIYFDEEEYNEFNRFLDYLKNKKEQIPKKLELG